MSGEKILFTFSLFIIIIFSCIGTSSYAQIDDTIKHAANLKDTIDHKYLDSLKKTTTKDRDAENKQVQQNNIDNGEPAPVILQLNDLNLVFKNTKTFEESDLKNLLLTGTTSDFSPAEFSNDSKKLEKFYFDNGFFDVHVDTSTKIEDKTNVTATLYIFENYRYRIDSINYEGLEDISDAAQRQLNIDKLIKVNDYYNKFNIQLEITRVVSVLQNNGYAIASSDPPDIIKTISTDTLRSRRIIVNLEFIPNHIFSFGLTHITLINNNYNIPSDDIKRQLEYQEGEIYSKEKLVLSENRISKLAIFENGRIQISSIDSNARVINLMINATVTNKYELKPEVLGYNISNKFYGGLGVSFTDKYFFGGARVLTASIRGLAHSIEDYRLEAFSEMTQPHLFNNDHVTGKIRPGISVYSVPDFRITQIKNITSVSYELPKYTYFNNLIAEWNLGNERLSYNVDLKESDTSDVVLLPGPFNLNIFTSSLSFTMAHYGTNSAIYPTTGSSAAYTLEESGLLGSIIKSIFNTSTDRFLKVTALNKFYFHLGDPTGFSVLASKILVGNILEYGENNFTVGDVVLNSLNVPRESKFISGGSSSIRGWKSKGLGNVRDKQFGGNFIIEASIEHRTKPFSDAKSIIKDLGFVTFIDIGNIWENIREFRINELAAAIGGGIRYYTIVGAIRFDLGFKLYDPDRVDKNWLFQAPLSELFKPARLEFQIGIGNTF